MTPDQVQLSVEDPADGARIVELHPYETPEVIATAIEAGHPAYLEWIGDSTRPPG